MATYFFEESDYKVTAAIGLRPALDKENVVTLWRPVDGEPDKVGPVLESLIREWESSEKGTIRSRLLTPRGILALKEEFLRSIPAYIKSYTVNYIADFSYYFYPSDKDPGQLRIRVDGKPAPDMIKSIILDEPVNVFSTDLIEKKFRSKFPRGYWWKNR